MVLKAAFEKSYKSAAVMWILVAITCLTVCANVASGNAAVVVRAHENDTLMVSCCALDAGFTPLHLYQWARLDAGMPEKAVGENSTTLFIPAMAVEDVGEYACTGSLNGDVANQSVISVHVFIAGEQYDPPAVISTTANPPIEEDGDLYMKCTATGYPEPTYEWIRLDEPLPVKAVGEHSALLIIPNFSVGDIGEYACVASNIAGVAESKPITPVLLGEGGFSLQYGRPLITTNSGSLAFEEGKTLLLHCCSQRPPLHTPDYAWIETNGNMPTKAAGLRSSALLIPNITAGDVGSYACLAIIGDKVSLSNSVDTVLIAHEPPVIQSTSGSITVDVGANITLSCSASGLPMPTYQWVKLNDDLPSAATGNDSSLLYIPDVSAEEAGMYACVASNNLGTAQSDPIEVHVTVIPPLYIPPSINSTSDAVVAVEEGTDLILTCSATGSPPPNYKWLRLDQAIPSKARGATSPTLTIPTVDWSDVGVYACLASNEGGTAQSRAIRTVMQGRQGNRITSIEGQKKGSLRTIIMGAVVSITVIVAITFGVAAGVVCFKGGLFGISSSYSIKNISLWDMMIGKNKGMTLLDLIIHAENTSPGVDKLESYYSDSTLNDPKIEWEIRRPFSDSDREN